MVNGKTSLWELRPGVCLMSELHRWPLPPFPTQMDSSDGFSQESQLATFMVTARRVLKS